MLLQVNQKLNSKSFAAGWLPSGGNRTAAQAFSQPGKGVSQIIGVGNRLGTPQMKQQKPMSVN